MTALEQKNTLRVLGKRNKTRLEALRVKEAVAEVEAEHVPIAKTEEL